MSPTIPTGSLVAVQSLQPPYLEGQVVAFNSSQGIITHRIISRKPIDNYFLYHTQGDANPTTDPTLITARDVIGVVSFSLPYLGYFLTWLHTLPGFILIVLLPTTILILQELLVIKKIWQEIQLPRTLSIFLLLSSISLTTTPSLSLLTSNTVEMDQTTLRVRSQTTPRPTMLVCPLDITINQQNSNTGPNSVNTNEVTINHSCTVQTN